MMVSALHHYLFILQSFEIPVILIEIAEAENTFFDL